jgi:hypothetical protein
MSTRTHAIIVAAAVIVAVFVLRMVAKRQLRSKYALLWLIVVFALMILAAFPAVLDELSSVLGVSSTALLFLFMAVGLIGALVGHLTWEVSRLETRIRTLAEDNAIMRNTLEERATPEGRAGAPRERSDHPRAR